jgi:hypothetical protein
MLKKIVGKKKFFEFRLTSNRGIPKYQDLAFCLELQLWRRNTGADGCKVQLLVE